MDQIKKYKNHLVVYRRRRGLSQKEVARLLNDTSADMLSRYECGYVLPPLPAALGLEIIYRVPAAFLFPNLYDELRHEIRAREEIGLNPGQLPPIYAD